MHRHRSRRCSDPGCLRIGARSSERAPNHLRIEARSSERAPNHLRIGARSSPLSRVQVAEVARLVGLEFEPIWVETIGDKDRNTSLRTLGKTDFFTREIDTLLLSHQIDAAIHSAKDLPDPLPPGLQLAALTRCLDPRDSLVLRPQETLQPHALIATSSIRREELVRALCPTAQFIDLRGSIEERLAKLHNHTADGVVVAEAALIRLGLTHLNRLFLPGETTPLQGRLAIVVRTTDAKTAQLFASIHAL